MSAKPQDSSVVAVSGIGILAPGAVGVDEFWSALAAGRTAVRLVERFDTAGLSSHKAALVEGFTPRKWIAPTKLRRMNGLSRLGLAAGRMAVVDAGGETLPVPQQEVGVAIGTAFGPVDTSAEYLKDYVEKGAALASPQLFAESVANAPGSHMAIEFGFRGFNLTFTQRESSALSALMFASSQIVKRTARAAVAGGVEEMNEIIYAVLDRIGALAHAGRDTDEECRPFDRRRNGIVVGEGGAMFVLHDPSVSLPGRVYACVSGFGIGRDATASVSDWGTDSATVAETMRSAVADAGIGIERIDAVWASANSSVRADRVEYAAIQQLFGRRIPPVVASKAFFGEYAAAGGLQLASAVLAVHHQHLPPTPGFRDGEPEMLFSPTREGSDAALRHVLVNSISAGGGIVCAVISQHAG